MNQTPRNLPDSDKIRRQLPTQIAARLASIGTGVGGDEWACELRRRVREQLARELPLYLQRMVRLENIRMQDERENRDIVRVRFPGGGRSWAYRCPGAKVGDIIKVPPTPYCQRDQYVPVVALGRGQGVGGWAGPVKTAVLTMLGRPVDEKSSGKLAAMGIDPSDLWDDDCIFEDEHGDDR